mmetsp:Transcript_6637/g.19472  ORF Transcript_6637/g.19472 Transcript_6637/m.19472 type:complete len:119 (-) Transcript_6637:64-420(-)
MPPPRSSSGCLGRRTFVVKLDLSSLRRRPCHHRTKRFRLRAIQHSKTSPSSSPLPSRLDGARKKPEVLSPVGGWSQLKAAVANGADAVYFGVTDGRRTVNGSFNARARAENFDYEGLP